MSRNIGVVLIVFTAVTMLLLAVINGSWFLYIIGGDFLITGLATWKWKEGTKYALGTGLIILAFSVLLLFVSDGMSVYGLILIIAPIAFLVGVLIVTAYDKRAGVKKERSDA